MMVYRGDIWLANLNPTKKPNEVGKTIPVLVFQNNFLNKNDFATTIVIPLSTKLIDDVEPLRLRIKARESLEKDSDLLVSQIRAIDNSRFIEKIASLDSETMNKIKKLFDEIVED
ncbi:MAG: type II toxin-antitoxin system PemK/MazF family toxin [Campylobacterota bacterium]|nr:type II toxin-antitoxin system PemK/MazF family toxin [Campylobacterota bacterium]